MNTVTIKNVTLGSGTPKIIVPIVGRTKDEIINAAINLQNVNFDIVEWRVDWFYDVNNFDEVRNVLKEMRKILSDTPLLFTFRTFKEGGEKAINPEDYVVLNKEACKSGFIDMVDVEAFTGDEYVKEIIECAHDNQVKVVASNHDFSGTPDKDELISRMRKMQEMNADIPKIAMMPKCKKDVLALLEATAEMVDEYADRPIITMSMGGLGLISRLCGEVFGSCATFGAVGQVSAPGQMNVDGLNTVLKLINETI